MKRFKKKNNLQNETEMYLVSYFIDLLFEYRLIKIF